MRRLTGEGRKQGQIWEGLPGTNGAPALGAYLDSAGVPTIGWGHTYCVTMGVVINQEQAEAFLDADLADTCQVVTDSVKCQLNDNQYAALVWFAFNVGINAFKTSTLVKRLNADPPDYAAVPSELAKWNMITDPKTGKKVVSNGLVHRRALETALWLTPVFAAPLQKPDAPTNEPELAIPVLATAQISQQSPDVAQPLPPPVATLQTTTGKGSAAAVVTGGTGVVLSAMSQAQPVLTAVQNIASGFGSMHGFILVGGASLALVSIGCMVWVFMHKRKSL